VTAELGYLNPALNSGVTRVDLLTTRRCTARAMIAPGRGAACAEPTTTYAPIASRKSCGSPHSHPKAKLWKPGAFKRVETRRLTQSYGYTESNVYSPTAAGVLSRVETRMLVHHISVAEFATTVESVPANTYARRRILERLSKLWVI
jgi:hypothetical protein